jgi:hypothetical protein
MFYEYVDLEISGLFFTFKYHDFQLIYLMLIEIITENKTSNIIYWEYISH